MSKLKRSNYNSALIVIDMIYDFVNPNGRVYYQNNRKILPNIINIIRIVATKLTKVTKPHVSTTF